MRNLLVAGVAATMLAAIAAWAPARALTLQLPPPGDNADSQATTDPGAAAPKTSFQSQPLNTTSGGPGVSWDLGNGNKVGFSVTAGPTSQGMYFGPGRGLMFSSPNSIMPPILRDDPTSLH